MKHTDTAPATLTEKEAPFDARGTERRQEELPRYDEVLESLFSNTPHSIFWKDCDLVYRGCNANFARIAGLSSPAEIVGKTDSDLAWTAEETEAIRESDRTVIANGKLVHDIEEHHLLSDGKNAILLTTKVPLKNAAGKVIGLLGVHADITNWRAAEEALRETTEKLRIITGSAKDAIIMMDDEGKVTFWNNAAKEIFGYSEEEAIGQDCHVLIMPEDYTELFQQGFQSFKETGTGFAIGKTVELEAKRKSGGTFPVEISLSAINVQGHWHTVGIVRDITKRKQSEQLFQRDVSRYMAMIDTVPAMVYLKDIDHRYLVANKAFCKTVGKELREIVGKTDYDIFPWEKADLNHKADKIVMDEDRKVIDHEMSIVDANGETRWISTTKVPLHDNQGLVTGIVGLVQDITEYHRSREQLVQADKLAAIGTLAAGVAHEINNPIGFISSNLNTMKKYLNKIKRFIEELEEGADKDDKEIILEILEDFGDAIDESIEGATRVKDIVADLKSFSRVDKAEKEYANINEGIESTLNIVWNELKYHCKVEKEFGDIPDIYCIPNQLNQVFMNLLVNAAHATKGKSGLITIKTWCDEKNVYASFKDNGVGIPQENLKKIFEPFFTTKDVGKGTGLGLSLAYDIIKKHDGSIEVKSEVGKGTEFIITLPQKGLENGDETANPSDSR